MATSVQEVYREPRATAPLAALVPCVVFLCVCVCDRFQISNTNTVGTVDMCSMIVANLAVMDKGPVEDVPCGVVAFQMCIRSGVQRDPLETFWAAHLVAGEMLQIVALSCLYAVRAGPGAIRQFEKSSTPMDPT